MVTMIGIFILLLLAMSLILRYCKKKNLKIGLVITMTVMTVYCLIVVVDMTRVSLHREPLFVFSVSLAQHPDYDFQIQRGLGYRIETKTINRLSEEGDLIVRRTEMTMNRFGRIIASSYEVVYEAVISDMKCEIEIEQNQFKGRVISQGADDRLVIELTEVPEESAGVGRVGETIIVFPPNRMVNMTGIHVIVTHGGILPLIYPPVIHAIDIQVIE